jgi:curved DNA-binding protein CbpA
MLRARYLELAKKHHPDSTGGDKASEERLKDVNRAYSLLKKRLATLPQPANGQSARAAG